MSTDYAQINRSRWDDFGQVINDTLRHAVTSMYGPNWSCLLATLEITVEKKVSLVVGVALAAPAVSGEPSEETETGLQLSLEAITLTAEEEAALGHAVSAWEADLVSQGLGLWNYLSFGTVNGSNQSVLSPVFASEMSARGENYHQWLATQGLGLTRLYAAHASMAEVLAASAGSPEVQPHTQQNINIHWAKVVQSQVEELLSTEPSWVCAGVVLDARDALNEPVVRVVAQLADGGEYRELPLDEGFCEQLVETATAWRLALFHAQVAVWGVTETFFQQDVPGRNFMFLAEGTVTGPLALLDGDPQRLVAHYEQLHRLVLAEAAKAVESQAAE